MGRWAPLVTLGRVARPTGQVEDRAVGRRARFSYYRSAPSWSAIQARAELVTFSEKASLESKLRANEAGIAVRLRWIARCYDTNWREL